MPKAATKVAIIRSVPSVRRPQGLAPLPATAEKSGETAGAQIRGELRVAVLGRAQPPPRSGVDRQGHRPFGRAGDLGRVDEAQPPAPSSKTRPSKMCSLWLSSTVRTWPTRAPSEL